MFDRERLLAGTEGEDRMLLARFLDCCQRVLRRHEPELTDFMNPPQYELCFSALESIPDLESRGNGGYRSAERKRICIYPDYYFPELLPEGVAVVAIKPSNEDASLSHRNYLGALLGLGLKREKVGDLIVCEDGSCQAVIASEIADFILNHLIEVDRFGVEVSAIEPEQIASQKPPKEIFSTVASLRLDSVASSGFGSSRTKMSRAIKQGRVRVNWKTVDDPAYELGPEDIISMRGRGRVEIAELQGRSNKGRIKLVLNRYT